MRFSLCLFLLSALLTDLHAAEYGMLSLRSDSFPKTITLNEGDIFEIVGHYEARFNYSYLCAYEKGTDMTQGATNENEASQIFMQDITQLTLPIVITGPIEILIRSTHSGTSHSFTVTYKLTRRPDPQTVTTATAN